MEQDLWLIAASGHAGALPGGAVSEVVEEGTAGAVQPAGAGQALLVVLWPAAD